MPSDKTISRLGLYRRSLHRLQGEGRPFVYSHQIASETGASAAQVRRDLMEIGYSGSPNRGYQTSELIRSIGEQLDGPGETGVALFGLGNLGRAIIAYVARQRPNLAATAAFDQDPVKTGRVIQGCRCHAVEELPQIAREKKLKVGIIAVPAYAAQDAADRLVAAGIAGLLNFAPHSLKVPAHVYVEEQDLTLCLEKVAYFARRSLAQRVSDR
jgi:redox-sensing transcriptional repressor